MALELSSFLPSFGKLGTYVLLFGWVLLFGGLVWAMWWLFAYNVRVIVHNPIRRGPAMRDKARLQRSKEDKSIRKLKLLKNKHDFMGTVPENHLQPVLGMFSRIGYQIHMVRDRHGALFSIPPPHEEGFLMDAAIAPALREWSRVKAREAADRYTRENFWIQYAPLLISITGFIIVGVIMLVVSRDLGTVAEAFNNAATAFKDATVTAAEQVVS